MKFRTALLATAFVSLTVTGAYAQEAAPAAEAPAKANVTVGAKVFDAAGGDVGTVASVTGDAAVVDTGAVKAGIPVASFAQSDKGLHISMTKAELEAAAKGAQAGAQEQLVASLTPGTAIADQNGGAVGKVESIDGDFVVVATANAKVKLPKTAFALGPNGPIIGMTAAQLEAAAKGATPAG